jgi:UDP-3-O-[3-hydroxymyristoyl] glucosamine N-acyltransferase
VVSAEAKIGRNVMVGAHAVVGPDVEIGDNSVIMNNVVLNGPVTIGKFCVIKDGAVIGSEGWGFVCDEDGIPFHPPQLGRIVLGDRVWIGSNSTIERAMVDDTVISANVKVDDLVHVGGGTVVGERCMLTAGSVVAYNVVIGEQVLVAPQSVIRERVTIVGNVVIGQGTVVIDDITVPGVYVGNPARFLKPCKNQ